MLLTRGSFKKFSFRWRNLLGVADSEENVEDGSGERLC